MKNKKQKLLNNRKERSEEKKVEEREQIGTIEKSVSSRVWNFFEWRISERGERGELKKRGKEKEGGQEQKRKKRKQRLNQ
jgi:hypothetical protein